MFGGNAHFMNEPVYHKTLIFGGIFIWRYWWYKQKSPKYETMKYRFEFSYTIGNKWTHILSMLVSV